VPPLWGFLAITVPLVLTPGASTAVVLRNSLSGGIRAGLATMVGANTGSVCFGILCAFGFAIALQQWPSVWLVLRIIGIAYMAWLGIRSLRHAFAGTSDRSPANISGSASDEEPPPVAAGLREGFLTNVMNPALATFYFVIVPQFIPAGASVARTVLVLTAIHVTLAASWHTVWALAGGTLSAILSSGRPRQALDIFSGVAMILLAVRLAIR
jgi:threonine/homoserine/homoserine lactone efflux protein